MEAIERVEIILSRSDLDQALDLLENAQVSGYTVVEKVRGKGHRGMRDALGLTDAFTNSLIIWYARPEEIERVASPLRDLLESAGGVLAISPARWLKP